MGRLLMAEFVPLSLLRLLVALSGLAVLPLLAVFIPVSTVSACAVHMAQFVKY
jgi:hypothetical protein